MRVQHVSIFVCLHVAFQDEQEVDQTLVEALDIADHRDTHKKGTSDLINYLKFAKNQNRETVKEMFRYFQSKSPSGTIGREYF